MLDIRGSCFHVRKAEYHFSNNLYYSYMYYAVTQGYRRLYYSNNVIIIFAASVSACLLALSSNSLPSVEAAGNLSYPATTWDLGDREYIHMCIRNLNLEKVTLHNNAKKTPHPCNMIAYNFFIRNNFMSAGTGPSPGPCTWLALYTASCTGRR